MNRQALFGLLPLEAREFLSANPTGLSPTQVQHAYGFDQAVFASDGKTIKADGAGQTIAIVDAYDDPTIANDLHVFDQQYGLPDPVFTKATPQGLPAVSGILNCCNQLKDGQKVWVNGNDGSVQIF